MVDEFERATEPFSKKSSPPTLYRCPLSFLLQYFQSFINAERIRSTRRSVNLSFHRFSPHLPLQ